MPMPTLEQSQHLYELSLISLFDRMSEDAKRRVTANFTALHNVYPNKPVPELWLTAIAGERDGNSDLWL